MLTRCLLQYIIQTCSRNSVRLSTVEDGCASIVHYQVKELHQLSIPMSSCRPRSWRFSFDLSLCSEDGPDVVTVSLHMPYISWYWLSFFSFPGSFTVCRASTLRLRCQSAPLWNLLTGYHLLNYRMADARSPALRLWYLEVDAVKKCASTEHLSDKSTQSHCDRHQPHCLFIILGDR